MATEPISVERRGATALLSCADSDQDWLTPDLLERLGDALAALADDAGVRVVLLTGAGGVFRRRWAVGTPGTSPPPATELRRLSGLMQVIAEAGLPVVAVIEGGATGAGLELALACDLRLADEAARFGFPESATGTPPLAGGAARLARIAGRGVALRLLLTGDTLTAPEALACGLVSGVHPAQRLAAEANRLATVIASRGPLALRFAKEAVAHGTEMPLDQALRYETDLTVLLQTTADRAEGVRAFAEKRTPQFHGE